MSVQINQYLMYAVQVPYEWHKEWEKANGKEFYEEFESYMDDSAFDSKIVHKDGIFCLFDGMNGDYIFIGRVLQKSSDHDHLGNPPIDFSSPTPIEQEFIREAAKSKFGIEGEFKTYLIAHYR